MRQEATRSQEKDEEVPEEVKSRRKRKAGEDARTAPPVQADPSSGSQDEQDRWVVRGRSIIKTGRQDKRLSFQKAPGVR